ncbi:MAG: sigma-70 family RNA polymerase sigma factor [Pseudomonadota bacterium]
MLTADGDNRAFATLYGLMAPKLFGLCLRITRKRELAEDALQEAFVHIWREAWRFDPERGRASAWVTVVVRNRAVDVLRKRGRGVLGREVGDDALAVIADPKAVTDGGVELMALARCLGRLDDRGQELVLLAYYEGWTREELAERIGAPVNSVKTWLRRGLAMLRLCLEEVGRG